MTCERMEVPNVQGKLIDVNGVETMVLIQCHFCDEHFSVAVRPLVEEQGGQITCPLCNAVMMVDVIPDSDPLLPTDMPYDLKVAISVTSRLPATLVEQLIDFIDLSDRTFESLIMAYHHTHPEDFAAIADRMILNAVHAIAFPKESFNE